MSPPTWFSRVIYPDDYGPDVAAVQALLGLPTTGRYDGLTQSYVRGVQFLSGKQRTGVVDAETAEVLGERARVQEGLAPTWFEHEAGEGHHCPCVLAVRQLLEVPHVGNPDYDVTLADAVKRFQGNRGLEVTGVVDAETAKLLGE